MGVIFNKTVTTRKEHQCFGCARKFPKGSTLERITSTDGGDISSYYWCNVCQSYWNEHMENGDDINFGELKSEDEEGWEVKRKLIEGET